MNMNYKICFVCTGNACRSPFAECVTKKLLADAGMNGIEVFSPVSYTHLDVYKRQLGSIFQWCERNDRTRKEANAKGCLLYTSQCGMERQGIA